MIALPAIRWIDKPSPSVAAFRRCLGRQAPLASGIRLISFMCSANDHSGQTVCFNFASMWTSLKFRLPVLRQSFAVSRGWALGQRGRYVTDRVWAVFGQALMTPKSFI